MRDFENFLTSETKSWYNQAALFGCTAIAIGLAITYCYRPRHQAHQNQPALPLAPVDDQLAGIINALQHANMDLLNALLQHPDFNDVIMPFLNQPLQEIAKTRAM